MTTTHEPVLVGKYAFADHEDVTFVKAYGLIYPLTTCCQATATGTEWGTACRACYEEIDTAFGACWRETEWTGQP